MTGPLPEHVRVAVIGAGLSGLGAGIARRMASSVWTTGGCTSWYLAADGRNPTPGPVLCVASGKPPGVSAWMSTSSSTAYQRPMPRT